MNDDAYLTHPDDKEPTNAGPWCLWCEDICPLGQQPFCSLECAGNYHGRQIAEKEEN